MKQSPNLMVLVGLRLRLTRRCGIDGDGGSPIGGFLCCGGTLRILFAALAAQVRLQANSW